ncbi:hypothetical protein SAMN05216339_101379 [Nitrosomonas eutropha]|uniref:Haem-binding uptake Tiki superfamily ChaN domain-containing protein n=1 Tax=Nitrosomonas eutropha TaxID=916 RepID=A0A1I7FAN3_9PROT|nr:hypothetical protein [Nitrosomonas eutropha]SFU33239.1 hypothetical protein SAMN05216339_101379 [Nitrosomonas eutropha]
MNFTSLKKIFYWWLLSLVLLPQIAVPSEVQSLITSEIEQGTITIIGEDHKRPESIQFFKTVIDEYLQQRKCLVVALEIASSQQMILDQVSEGKADISNITIPPMIDHPAYRIMIHDLAEMKRGGKCLKLLAIDADLKTSSPRDEWMAMVLENQTGRTPILALLGGLHALKRVDWSREDPSPFVAEILVERKHKVKTYPQVWKNKNCHADKRLISSDTEEAAKLINDSLISLLNAYDYETVKDVVDGVILWECK